MTLKEPRRLVWDDRLTAADKAEVDKVNESLARLNTIRAVEINLSGRFARSKIAWKLATWQHALLHRIVALMDGIAVAWNSRCTLSSMLSIRALMETIAVMADMEAQIARLLADEDLRGLDAVAQRGTFASRDPVLLEEFPDIAATNVITLIDKVDGAIDGFREHYDGLSERCHPNAPGHYFMFATLDRLNGSVRYCDEREQARNAEMNLAALMVLPLVESMSARLDGLIKEVSDLHHRVAPVGGASGEMPHGAE
jgi:hypothetical protein